MTWRGLKQLVFRCFCCCCWCLLVILVSPDKEPVHLLVSSLFFVGMLSKDIVFVQSFAGWFLFAFSNAFMYYVICSCTESLKVLNSKFVNCVMEIKISSYPRRIAWMVRTMCTLKWNSLAVTVNVAWNFPLNGAQIYIKWKRTEWSRVEMKAHKRTIRIIIARISDDSMFVRFSSFWAWDKNGRCRDMCHKAGSGKFYWITSPSKRKCYCVHHFCWFVQEKWLLLLLLLRKCHFILYTHLLLRQWHLCQMNNSRSQAWKRPTERMNDCANRLKKNTIDANSSISKLFLIKFTKTW